MPAITIDESRATHIFRNARGHFREDTPVNHRTLIEVATRAEHFLGADRFGNHWFADTRSDGIQVWVHVRDGKITNGGINAPPQNLRRLGGPT
jgi:hypothetical protein